MSVRAELTGLGAEAVVLSADVGPGVGLTRNVVHAHRWDKIRINGINIGWTETEGEDVIRAPASRQLLSR
jgi:hypothetical protein